MQHGNWPLVAVLALGVSACNVNTGDSGDDQDGLTAVSIQDLQASAASLQGASVVANTAQSAVNLSAIARSAAGLPAPAFHSPWSDAENDARANALHAAEARLVQVPTLKAAAALSTAYATTTIATTSGTCSDGGGYTYSGSYDDVTGVYAIDFLFDDCKETTPDGDGEVLSGPMSLTSSDGTNFTLTLGDGDGTLESDGDLAVQFYSNDFSNFYASMVADLSLGMSYSVAGSTVTYSYTLDGAEQYNEFFRLYEVDYDNLALSVAADGSTGQASATGAVSESWTDDGDSQAVTLTFTALGVDWTADATAFDYSIAGTVAMDFTPDSVCYEGSNVVATTTTIHQAFADGYPTAGVVTLNDSVTVTYNSDGTVTVADNRASYTFTSDQALEEYCPILDHEEGTSRVNTSGSGIAYGDDMLITLTWTGGDTSDMDLHLNYYDTTSPSSTTAYTSYVSYTGATSCSSPVDSTASWRGMDIDADGVCDAGLDYDDVNGYGPEHITAASLRNGYYIVSVNSYSLSSDPDATVNVTLDIGDTLFTFPVHTFTTADGNGTDPNSWYRVADLRVTTDQVEVLVPNTNLSPYERSATTAPVLKPGY